MLNTVSDERKNKKNVSYNIMYRIQSQKLYSSIIQSIYSIWKFDLYMVLDPKEGT